MNENVQAYLLLVQRGKITIDDVPSEYREEVAKYLEANE